MFILATKRYVRRQIARMAVELMIKLDDLGLEIEAVANEAAGTVPDDAGDADADACGGRWPVGV